MSKAIKRITYRVITDNGFHVAFSLWVNGALISAPGAIILRKDEFTEFIQKLDAIDDSEWYKKENGQKRI